MVEVKIDEKLIAEQGLSPEEYEKIKKLLGREPNYTELGMFSAMWSEHCSYKNSKAALKLFPTTGKRVLQGPGENAGIVDIGDDLAVVMKIESHNHPSAIEPYEASATGAGGVIRDIFTMGARPIALLNSLRFGKLEGEKVKYLFKEVGRGFSTYANEVGLPIVGGEVYFDESYEGNPLVNAMCVGIVKHSDVVKARTGKVGNLVMIVGGETGRDGVAGAAFASGALEEEAEQKRGAVAIGDPKMGRLVREACLELMSKGLVAGMQDMGAAGLTCSTSETASKGGTGIEIDVSLVPRKEKGMIPYEIMLSESQERMLVIVEEGKLPKVNETLSKWKVPGTVIGKVTGDGILRIKEEGKVVAEVKATALTEAPVYTREEKEPANLKDLRSLNLKDLKEPTDYNQILLKLLNSPTIASKEDIYKKGIATDDLLVSPGSDAAVLKVGDTKKAIALTVDGNGGYCYLNPFRGGEIMVAEAARNLVCSGAQPLALTDCLNFGDPGKPEIYWQFKNCIKGMSQACKKLDIPVISGNVSFYNENPQGAVDPTPTVGMVGLIEDRNRYVTQGFKKEGDLVVLLGETKEELGGTQYLKIIHDLKRGDAPELDLDLESRVQKVCLEAIRAGMIHSAHDLSEGGLAVALAECAMAGESKARGAAISLPEDKDIRGDALLFGESQSRIILTLSSEDMFALSDIVMIYKVPLTIIGKVEGKNLIIKKGKTTLIKHKVDDLEKVYTSAIPELVG